MICLLDSLLKKVLIKQILTQLELTIPQVHKDWLMVLRIMGAIKGRDAIYVWTDTALFLMKFVGQPFTFSFEQVGTNCGLVGKNACIEVDGSAYWMSENGFFTYDGQLKSMPCLVEDDVYDDINLQFLEILLMQD